MRFIQHQARAVFFLELDNFAQERQIALHREYTFRDDERARLSRLAAAGR